jgi:hypothetical protein
MVDLIRAAGVTYVGGLYVNRDLKDCFEGGAVVRFNWGNLDKAQFTKLLTAVRQGFTLSLEGPVSSILNIIKECDGAPKFPDIGYFGKKSMNVLVLASKAEQYKTDLIATAHMVDVNLSNAVNIGPSNDPRWKWLNVNGYAVYRTSPDASKGTRWGRQQDGSHLKPATSKMMNLVRGWTAELLPERQELLDWIESRPPMVFKFKSDQ